MAKAAVVAAFLLCASTVAAAPAGGQWHYVALADTDAPFEDLQNAGTKDLHTLESLCTNTPACKGFNSNGWLKNDTDPSVQKPQAGCTLYVKTAGPPPPPQPLRLWPLPKSYSSGTTVLGVAPAPDFGFFGPSTASATLTAAYARYSGIIFQHAPDTDVKRAGPMLTGLIVSVETVSEAPPQLETDESYTLTVSATGGNATLTARTIYGALHGLETFSQLIIYDFDSLSYTLPDAPWTIDDAPRFQHRGMLLDSARHFEPVASIKHVIDSAAYAKLNVIHWHMVDTQSFPFESKTFPTLWNGAWAPSQRFTQADVRDVVEYARMRGIRVMVEFDVPGHAASWCTGRPDICPSAQCLQPLNVANNATFDVINGLLKEVSGGIAGGGLFPDDFVHLGGDEVDTTCWMVTPSVASWLKARNFTGDDGYAYFVKRAAELGFANQRTVVQWVEVFDHFGSELDNRTVVHVWKAKSTLNAVLEAGYRALLSDNDLWYLDHLSLTWQDFYNNEPLANVSDPAQQALLLGGEAEMWGETVDESDILQTIWPRAGAFAERMWSPRDVNNTVLALPRLQYFRCRLNGRGVAAAPVDNSQAREAPPGPGDCYLQ